jgi:hypothetical protein
MLEVFDADTFKEYLEEAKQKLTLGDFAKAHSYLFRFKRAIPIREWQGYYHEYREESDKFVKELQRRDVRR